MVVFPHGAVLVRAVWRRWAGGGRKGGSGPLDLSSPGVPKAIMIAKLGGGATGQAALDAALEAGEVHGVVGDNGQTFYMWQEYEITKKSGTRHSVSTSRSMALDHATLEGIAAILDGVQWGFNVVKAVEQEKSTGQIPDIVWDKLKHALTGMDKAVWCSLTHDGPENR